MGCTNSRGRDNQSTRTTLNRRKHRVINVRELQQIVDNSEASTSNQAAPTFTGVLRQYRSSGTERYNNQTRGGPNRYALKTLDSFVMNTSRFRREDSVSVRDLDEVRDKVNDLKSKFSLFSPLPPSQNDSGKTDPWIDNSRGTLLSPYLSQTNSTTHDSDKKFQYQNDSAVSSPYIQSISPNKSDVTRETHEQQLKQSFDRIRGISMMKNQP